MSFIEREVQFPGRVKLTKVSEENNSVTCDVEKSEGNIIKEGTQITAAWLNSIADPYPVGSIYMSVLATSPASLFGGTWAAWGSGRVPVGVGNNGETNYTAAEQTGGSENSIAVHTHSINQTASGGHTHPMRWRNTDFGTGGSRDCYTWYNVNDASRRTEGQVAAEANHTHTISNANAGVSGGNRQPFITCYMWKRMA